MTSFNGDEGEFITTQEAKDMIDRYLKNKPEGTVKAIFLGKNKIDQILSQSGCVGLRVYLGLDENGAQQLIMVGADTNMDDQTSGLVLDRGQPCPFDCPTGSSLH